METFSVAIAVTYIQQMYALPELTLAAVSAYCGVHPNYLSRCFKAETGQCFVNYRAEVRMCKAASLAISGELMYIAAEKSGFSDPYYFGRCYKRYFGINYSEFSKLCQSSKINQNSLSSILPL